MADAVLVAGQDVPVADDLRQRAEQRLRQRDRREDDLFERGGGGAGRAYAEQVAQQRPHRLGQLAGLGGVAPPRPRHRFSSHAYTVTHDVDSSQ
ncbi:hypothetical protein GCM10020220_048030 [Nonomuraea rubra]